MAEPAADQPDGAGRANSRAPGRLAVGVIGAGRVGAVLAAALRNAGHQVVGASGVSEASVSRIDTLLPGVPRMEPQEVVAASDLVLLTVPDDALAPVVSGLARLGAWRPGQLAMHAAGRFGVDILSDAAAAGVLPLAIHPAMTFTGTSLDLARLADTAFAVTAPAPLLPIAQALVVEMGGEPVIIEEADRPAYHAAIVHAANHGVTLAAQAAAVLGRLGIEEPGRILGPVVQASIDNALRDAPGSVSSLTGPVVRGDAGTIAAHLAALEAVPETRSAYRAMARATADLALAGGRIGPAAYADLIATLGLGED